MDNKVNVVEEDPIALATALNGVGVDAVVALEGEFYFVGNGLGLAVVECRSDQEEVGETRVNRVQFEDAGIFAFFVFTNFGCGLDEDAGLFVRLRGGHSKESVSMAMVAVDREQGTGDREQGIGRIDQAPSCITNFELRAASSVEIMGGNIVEDGIREVAVMTLAGGNAHGFAVYFLADGSGADIDVKAGQEVEGRGGTGGIADRAGSQLNAFGSSSRHALFCQR